VRRGWQERLQDDNLKKYKFIEHTADIGLEAYGQNLADAYGNAAYGLFSIITDLRKVRKTESRVVEIQEKTPEDLLFEWLNYLIYLFDAEQMIFKECHIQDFDGRRIKAICYGEKADLTRHQMKTGVKAATYHLLKVDPEKNRVQVIFDI
jgi:SHS2 domain-containing protein